MKINKKYALLVASIMIISGFAMLIMQNNTSQTNNNPQISAPNYMILNIFVSNNTMPSLQPNGDYYFYDFQIYANNKLTAFQLFITSTTSYTIDLNSSNSQYPLSNGTPMEILSLGIVPYLDGTPIANVSLSPLNYSFTYQSGTPIDFHFTEINKNISLITGNKIKFESSNIFNLFINNQSYYDFTSLTLYLNNGTYPYYYFINGTNYSGILYVNGYSQTINLLPLNHTSLTISVIIFLIILFGLIIGIGRYTENLTIVLITIFSYFLIGYAIHLSYIGLELFIVIEFILSLIIAITITNKVLK